MAEPESAVRIVVREPPTALRRVLAVWRRHARVYGGVFVSNATPAVLEPLFLLASVGLGVGKHVQAQFNGLAYDAYMAPGILASATLFTAAFESTYGTFVRFRFQGTYEAILATPATVRDVVLGELLWCASKGAFFSTIIGSVLAVLGFVRGPAALAIPVFGFLHSLAIAGIGLLAGSRVRVIDHIQPFFTLVFTPMVFFSGFMFPVGQLPGPLSAVAQALPTYHAVETFRILATGPEHASQSWSWACPLMLPVYAVVLAALGGTVFARRILSER